MKTISKQKQHAANGSGVTESGSHFKNGTSKRLASRVNILILFLSLFCLPTFGQDGEMPVIIQYRIITDGAQVQVAPGDEVIGTLQKGQTIPVDSLQLENDGYLPVVIDYLDNEWAKNLCKEIYNSAYYTGDLWYGYVKTAYAEKVTGNFSEENEAPQEPISLENLQPLLYIAGILALIFFFWLAAKSKKGEIIIYKSWGDAFLTLGIGGASLLVTMQDEVVLGLLLILASFVWSCWISLKRNSHKSTSFGIVIGIARMLIVYLLIAAAIIAWSSLLAKGEKMQQASHMKRSSAASTKAKNDKIREAEMAGIIAAIGFAILAWLTVSFIHTEKDNDHQSVLNKLKNII
jgi:hypothetical protein